MGAARSCGTPPGSPPAPPCPSRSSPPASRRRARGTTSGRRPIAYNLLYSGETYGGAVDMIRYALTFPVQQARVDGLWTAGGAGCLVLLTRVRRDPGAIVALAWVAAACAAIVINGGRGLPQYFVQANPALAMAAAFGAWHAVSGLADALGRVDRRRGDARRAVARGAASEGARRHRRSTRGTRRARCRERPVPGPVRRPAPDRQARAGGRRAPRPVPRRPQRAVGHRVRLRVLPGRAGAVANRRSASRFFWSRPLVVGFNEGPSRLRRRRAPRRTARRPARRSSPCR